MLKRRAVQWILCGLLLIMSIFCIAAGCANGISDDKKETEICEIKYRVSDSECGWINGAMDQNIRAGADASAVEADANEGYVFIGWSDGVKTARRQDLAVKGDMTVYAEFEKEKYSVRYIAGQGGKIEGEAEQEVGYKDDGKSVTAVAEFGYMFVKWSDGNENAERQDTWITQPLEVTAEFAREEKTYRYDYHYATGGNEEKEVKLHIDHMETSEFAVPVKEHSIFGGWYADRERKTAVTDANGKLVIGQELFRTQTDTLYAKWTAEEEVNYTILLVFVTEIDAHGPVDLQGDCWIDIEYKLTEEELKICQMVPQKLKEKLNEIFYGLINFEIDTYFTKEPVTSNMLSGPLSPMSLEVSAENIPEVRPLINQYRTVITTFNLNDYEGKYHPTNLTGTGEHKFARVYLDSFLRRVRLANLPIDAVLDEKYEGFENRWDGFLETYLHEFCHTIELGYDYFEYHKLLGISTTVHKTTMELTEEYLLNLAEYNGELVGIPYDYWVGNLSAVPMRYEAEVFKDGEYYRWGRIISDKVQDPRYVIGLEVPYGGTGDTITAVADPGYQFVKWSDGVTTPTRRDENITSLFIVWAIFEPIE